MLLVLIPAGMSMRVWKEETDEIVKEMEQIMEEALEGRGGNRNRGNDPDSGGSDCSGVDFQEQADISGE